MIKLFSIIIPVYNTVHELPRCIDSILEQTFQDFELILVDDGSKDGSGDICDRYAEKDRRVVVIHKENGGCSEARNEGVRKAQGKYFLFVDSDDMWCDNNALMDISKIINQNSNIDVICFGVEIIDENGKVEKKRIPVLPENCSLDKLSIVKHLVYTNQFISTSYVKVLRSDFFFENNLFFIKGLLSEDIEWSARILVGAKSILIYPKAFYRRIRRSEGSITSSIGEKNVIDIIGSIEKGIFYAKKHSENRELLKLYYEYWAYQYAMVLGFISNLKSSKEYKSIISRVSKLKWLLKYDHVKKVKLVHGVCKIIGIHNTIRIMGLYYKFR